MVLIDYTTSYIGLFRSFLPSHFLLLLGPGVVHDEFLPLFRLYTDYYYFTAFLCSSLAGYNKRIALMGWP